MSSPNPNLGTTVPKNIRRIQEEYQGYPLRYIAAVGITGLLCFLLVLSLFGARNKVPVLILLFMIIAFFFKFMRTNAVMTRSWLWFQYFIRSLRGQTIIPKYRVSAAFMQSIVPIREFHSGGLIEFTNMKWGMLLRADPMRVSDDDLNQHLDRVRALTDSLHGELHIKSYVVSMSESGITTERGLLGLMNEPGHTKVESEHLYSLYSESIENKVPVIQWRFYIGVYFGRYTILREAEIAKAQYLPGIVDRLQRAGCHIIPITDRIDLSRTYRDLVSCVRT